MYYYVLHNPETMKFIFESKKHLIQSKEKKKKKKREQTKLNIISILLFLKIISSNLETSWCPTTKPRLLSTLWDVVDELA